MSIFSDGGSKLGNGITKLLGDALDLLLLDANEELLLDRSLGLRGELRPDCELLADKHSRHGASFDELRETEGMDEFKEEGVGVAGTTEVEELLGMGTGLIASTHELSYERLERGRVRTEQGSDLGIESEQVKVGGSHGDG